MGIDDIAEGALGIVSRASGIVEQDLDEFAFDVRVLEVRRGEEDDHERQQVVQRLLRQKLRMHSIHWGSVNPDE